MPRRCWLVKQEPEACSWSKFVKAGRAAWAGVRNFQARNNLHAMKQGDPVPFVKQSRQSVTPLTAEQFARVLALAGTKAGWGVGSPLIQ